MSLASLFAFALAFGLAAATPGPGVAAIVARALALGFARTLPMIAGLVLGDLIYLTLVVFGLSLIAAQLGVVFTLIKYAGAAYLLYLAWKLWSAPVDAEETATPSATRASRLFVGGLAVTLGNPKVMVFYMALLPMLIDVAHVGTAGYLELLATIAVLLSGIMCSYALLAARASRLLRRPGARRWLNRGTGTVMAGAAAAVATTR